MLRQCLLAALALSLPLSACGDDDGRLPPAADMGPMVTDAGPPANTSPWVDPACTDGTYSERLPPVDADVSDLSFTGDISAYVDAFLDRRYPVGAMLVRGGRMNDDYGGACDLLYAGTPSTAEELNRQMGTIVHECGHFYDLELSNAPAQTYVVNEALQLTCERGDTTDRGGDTFARSLLMSDEYALPACPSGSVSAECDFYADIYLNGNPEDTVFESGDQGFNMLLEEAYQYVNSLAATWATLDQMPSGLRTTAKDGILTFLWYVERYLRMARLDYPDAYERLSGDACWREAILVLWGRAWLYLEATDAIEELSINGVTLMNAVTAPELLEEIELLRAADGC